MLLSHSLSQAIEPIIQSMAILDLDHIQLACPRGSEEQARTFFSGLLGLIEIEKPAPLVPRGGCWFQVGSRQLHLGVEENFKPATKAHPAFAVDDTEALFESLTAAGIACEWDYVLPEVKRFFTKDPWGNRLEFLQKL